jgi:hypothetical protein
VNQPKFCAAFLRRSNCAGPKLHRLAEGAPQNGAHHLESTVAAGAPLLQGPTRRG